jgi:hypothetical protein
VDKWMILSLACLSGGIALVALGEMGWGGTLLGAFVTSLLPQPRPVRREIERLSRRPPPPPPPTEPPGAPPPAPRFHEGATLLFVAMCMACGGAQTSADTAHASACVAVQRDIQAEHQDGSLTYDQARARIACTRAVCDRIEQALGD